MDYKELASCCLKRSKMENEDVTKTILEISSSSIINLLKEVDDLKLYIEHRDTIIEKYQYLCEEYSEKCRNLLARAEAAEARAEKAEKEIERLKDIMRDEGIVVIPSKYPGCKSEWNLPNRG